MNPTSKAYREGQRAALAGRHESENPFSRVSDQWDQWRAGFLDGLQKRREAAREKR